MANGVGPKLRNGPSVEPRTGQFADAQRSADIPAILDEFFTNGFEYPADESEKLRAPLESIADA